MTEPVCAPDGFSYERSAIDEWLQEHNTSPMTGEPIAAGVTLTPNHNLRSQIASYRQEIGASKQVEKQKQNKSNCLEVRSGPKTVFIPIASDGSLSM